MDRLRREILGLGGADFDGLPDADNGPDGAVNAGFVGQVFFKSFNRFKEALGVGLEAM